MFLDMMGGHGTDADYQEGYQVLHNQFVASAKTVRLGKTINPDFVFGNMICGITFYPATCDPADILAAEHKRQSGIYYCSDVQAKGKYGSYKKKK